VEEDIDVLGTQRVVSRAMLSSVLCIFGVVGAVASTLVLSKIVSMVFLVIVLGVSISSIRTLTHPDASVTGNLRWLGVALSSLAAFGAVLTLLAFGLAFVRSL
jgi:hypothetical protein